MSSLYEQIQADIATAMKARDAQKTTTLRTIFSELKKHAIDNRTDGSSGTAVVDAEAIKVLKRLEKQRRDSIEQFEKGGRQDLVEKEKGELAIISAYLPQQMSAQEIMLLIKTAITRVNAQSAKDFGLVMKEVLSHTQGRADGKEVSALIKTELEKL